MVTLASDVGNHRSSIEVLEVAKVGLDLRDAWRPAPIGRNADIRRRMAERVHRRTTPVLEAAQFSKFAERKRLQL